MTLDEAIKHAEEVANREAESAEWFDLGDDSSEMFREKYAKCKKCAEEQRQLAEWLKELKWLKEQTNVPDTNVGELISRKTALKKFTYSYKGERIPDYDCDNFPTQISFVDVRKVIRGLPSVEPERKTGKWIDGKCNRCGTHAPFWEMATTYYCSDYCPKCGAKMEVQDDQRTAN